MKNKYANDSELIYEAYKRSYDETMEDEDESSDEARRSKNENERDIMRDIPTHKSKKENIPSFYEHPLYVFAKTSGVVDKEGREMNIAMDYMLGEKVPVKIKINEELVIEPYKKLTKVYVWAILTSAKMGTLELYNTGDKNIAENIEKIINKALNNK